MFAECLPCIRIKMSRLRVAGGQVAVWLPTRLALDATQCTEVQLCEANPTPERMLASRLSSCLRYVDKAMKRMPWQARATYLPSTIPQRIVARSQFHYVGGFGPNKRIIRRKSSKLRQVQLAFAQIIYGVRASAAPIRVGILEVFG